MKSSALGRKLVVCFISLLGFAIPMIFTACGGGIVSPLSASRSSGPTIAAVVPDSGPAAGGTTVVINGTNLTGSTQQTPPSVSFGGVAATHVAIVSPTQVRAIAPAHSAGAVSVQVTTADGKSSTLASAFTYTQTALTITSVSPNSGPTAGGTAVVVTGSNFSNGAIVSFGGISASNVSFVSSTQLKATTPAHAAGSVNVGVTNPGGTQATLPNAFTYGGSTTLSVNSVSPISGPADGGTAVTISGSNFQSGISVSFGGFPASSITVSNSTTIQATTPAHSSGSVTVTVTNTDGQSATLTSGFSFHSVDLAWSAPASSPVTITGYNVYRGLTSGGPFGRLNGSTPLANTSYNDGSVQGATTYYYEVKSVDSNGTESAPEGPVPVTTSP